MTYIFDIVRFFWGVKSGNDWVEILAPTPAARLNRRFLIFV